MTFRDGIALFLLLLNGSVESIRVTVVGTGKAQNADLIFVVQDAVLQVFIVAIIVRDVIPQDLLVVFAVVMRMAVNCGRVPDLVLKTLI